MIRVLILGGDSDFNLGDTAALTALCQCLGATDPRAELTIVSGHTSGPRLPEGVKVIPRGPRGLEQLVQTARASDLIIVGGEGLFQDDVSRAKIPYWALRLATLRLLNNNIVGHCVGAGPLDHADSRLFARLACAHLRSVSVRDEFARRALASCTPKPIEVVPDPAFMLQPAPPGAGEALLRSLGLKAGRPIIGVALRHWFHRLGGFVPHRIRSRRGVDRAPGHAEMARMLTQIASALRTLAHRHDAAVLLMPTYNVKHEGDAVVCRKLRAELRDLTTRLVLIDDPCLYKAVAGQLMLMVSARMRPLILAASMGVPIVGLAYNGKFEALFDALGVAQRLLWLDEFAAGSQAQRLEELAAAAIGDVIDLRSRSQALADTVFSRTAALLNDPRLRAAASNQ